MGAAAGRPPRSAARAPYNAMTDAQRQPETMMAALLDLPIEQCAGYVRAQGDCDAFLISLAEESERLAVAEVSRGLEASARVLALADALGGQRCQARAHRARAQTLAYAGRFDDALPIYRRADELARRAGDEVESAYAKMSSLHALASLGNYDEAIAAGEEARRAFNQAGESLAAARADVNLGATHQMRGDPAAALVHLDRARPHFSADPVTLAKLDSNRGHALVNLDDFPAAEAAFESALRTFVEAGLTWAAAIVEGNLGELAARQSRLQRAFTHYESARRLIGGDSAPLDLARMRAEQADAFATLGLLSDALADYQRAIPTLDEHGLAFESTRASAGLGRVLLRLGRLAEAAAPLQAAADGFERLGHAVQRARLNLDRAELLAAGGQRAAAETLVHEALPLLAERPSELAVAHQRLARYALADERLSEADEHASRAVGDALTLGLAPLLADALHTRGVVRRGQRRAAEALGDLRAAVEQVERIRGTLHADHFRAAFQANRLGMYEDLVAAALERADADGVAEAFRTVERAKSRSLLDLVARDVDDTAGVEPGSPDSELAAELARLRARVNQLYSRLADDTHERRDGERLRAWRAEIEHAERAARELEGRLASGRGIMELFASPAELDSVRAAVPPHAALVEYYVAGDELLAFVLRRGGVTVRRKLAAANELADACARVQFQVRRALRPGAFDGGRGARLEADARRECAALHMRLLEPLLSELRGIDELIVVPHGPLHALPFAALSDERGYVVQRWQVRSSPSASVLTSQRERAARPTGGSLVVGIPDAHAPLIEHEARRVREILSADLLIGSEATAAAVRARAVAAEMVHFACHGHFSADQPLASGLRLADRWLTVGETFGLRLAARLVTLSGCETGRGIINTGDEFVGLARGFLAAGAASLVVSLWSVNDASTTEFMGYFYQALCSAGASESVATALRGAQLALMSERAHPAFWAPFVLIGEA
ncbi:MAG: hypothetical protein CHACPFDD_00475 [Phycisphaerae bacterium]|nr:hypothetical protein [Phycisphaerae bacterium]